jgi:hypothetical protein
MPGSKKADKEAKTAFILKHGKVVPISAITRQIIDVRTATISDESREDMRKQIEQDIVRIVHASKTDFFPMQSGVRWPNNKCAMCYLRGICTGDDKLRDELATRDLKGDQNVF